MYSKIYPIVILAFISLMACNSPKNGHVKHNENTKQNGHQARDTNQSGIDDSASTTAKKSDAVASKPIEYVDAEDPTVGRTKLKFASGVVIDIRDVDPYIDLPYDMIWEAESHLERLYELSHLSRSEQDKVLSGARINPDALRESNFLRIRNSEPNPVLTDSKAAIAYHATYYSNEEDILATQGYVIIYDSLGNKLREIHDKKDGFSDIRLSTDGKYLMQKYGVDYGEDGGGQLDRGFRFYNTQTGEMVFEWELGKDPYIKNYGFLDNFSFLATSFCLHGDYYEYFIFDISKSATYRIKGSRQQFSNQEFMRSLFSDVIKTGNSDFLELKGFKKIN